MLLQLLARKQLNPAWLSALRFHHSDLGPGRRCWQRCQELSLAVPTLTHCHGMKCSSSPPAQTEKLGHRNQELVLPTGDPDPTLGTTTGSLRESRMSHLGHLLLWLVNVLRGEISIEVQNLPWEEKRELTSSRTSALHHPAHPWHCTASQTLLLRPNSVNDP